ncbi:MAG: PIG-L family deacetylase [Bacteroidales bacterium]|nr:PIG-L family deacetylase [Bacteroidales bacterium]
MIKKNVAIIVAHPDDETLWAGGTILSHPSWKCFIVCLTRSKDAERSVKFHKALKVLKSEGIMGKIDDGTEQHPLNQNDVETTIKDLLPQKHFDLIITHNPDGEYTRHIRHEETGRAVINLWYTNKIVCKELWIFAYEDGGKAYYPIPVEKAAIYHLLTKRIWLRKYSIMTEIYGFEKNSWEAQTTPKAESFWQFRNSYEAEKWLKQ